MRTALLALLIAVAACRQPCEMPPEYAILEGDHWRVQLADGRSCSIPHAFWVMERPEQALEHCRWTAPSPP